MNENKAKTELFEETKKNRALISAIEKEIQIKAENLRNHKFNHVFR